MLLPGTLTVLRPASTLGGMNAADLPPKPPAVEAPAPAPDPVSAYLAEVHGVQGAAVAEGYVDPHLQDTAPTDAVEVDGGQDEDDVDSGGLGPSDAELAAGDQVDGAEGAEFNEDGLPGQEGDEHDVDNGDAGDEGDPNKGNPEPAADPVADMVDTLRAKNPKLSMRAAVELAEQALGVGSDGTDDQGADDPNKGGTDEIPSAEALEAERRELDKKWRKGTRELEDDTVLEGYEARIAEIDALLPQARVADQQRTERVTNDFEEAAQNALDLYPEAGKAGSPMFKLMAKIHDDLAALNDPIISDVNKPLIIAQMAARELRIAPRRASAQANNKAGAQATAARRTGGAASMTAPLAAASQRRPQGAPSVVKTIDAIQTPEDYERLVHGR